MIEKPVRELRHRENVYEVEEKLERRYALLAPVSTPKKTSSIRTFHDTPPSSAITSHHFNESLAKRGL